jgi:hypothetical protein
VSHQSILAALTAEEPSCCNTSMVHNSWNGEWECASAYFALVDEHDWIAEGMLELVEADEVSVTVRDDLAHWRASRRRCDHEGCAPAAPRGDDTRSRPTVCPASVHARPVHGVAGAGRRGS